MNVDTVIGSLFGGLGYSSAGDLEGNSETSQLAVTSSSGGVSYHCYKSGREGDEMKIYCGEKLTEMLKCRHYQTEDCDECSSEERYIKLSELRELLENKSLYAKELTPYQRAFANGRNHHIDELLAELEKEARK